MIKRGVVLVNLGSPDSPSTKDVRSYLDEFLMDKYVLDIPYWLRTLIVKKFILPKRPAESAQAYKKIWRKDGSPLIAISKKVKEALKVQIEIPVSLGMRYGRPSIKDAFIDLISQESGINEVLLLPLYPHYAMSSVETVVEKTKEIIQSDFPAINLTVFNPFYNNEIYQQNLATIISKHLPEDTEHLLFSYHGLPERHIKKTDPTKSHCFKITDCCIIDSEAHNFCYKHHVVRTTQEVIKLMNKPGLNHSISFQSRLGWDKWIEPYTDKVIPELVQKGVKKLSVVCPAFVSDCLETLEEIGIRAKEDFITAGGEVFTLIPCLNDDPIWIETLAGWINNYIWGNQKEVLMPT